MELHLHGDALTHLLYMGNDSDLPSLHLQLLESFHHRAQTVGIERTETFVDEK